MKPRRPLLATQTTDGGLWHAGVRPPNDDGYVDTLCGRYGWVDHQADGSPTPAVVELFADDDYAGQPIECLTCLRVARSRSLIGATR